MAYSETEWSVARAFFERGLYLQEIVDRDEVKIKSKSQLSKKSKAENWERNGKTKRIFEQDVEIKQAVAEIKKQKETFGVEERNVHEVLVDERTKHIKFFNEAAVMNVQQAMNKHQRKKVAPSKCYAPRGYSPF